MIFSLSMLMLWNNWQTHQGKQSLFAPAPVATNTKETTVSPTGTGKEGVPIAPSATAVANVSGTPAGVPGEQSLSSGQTVVITTDVLKLSFDLQGAQIVQADLLAFPATEHPEEPTVLLARNKKLVYVVQSGLTGAVGLELPTHLTTFKLISDELDLKGETLTVKFAAVVNDVRLTKIFTLRRSSYAITVDHVIENAGTQSIQPAVYLQITRDDSDPDHSASALPSFLSGPANFVGPAVYSEQQKFQKVTFSEIEKHKDNFIKQADNGWFAMIQHYFVTAWIPEQGKVRSYQMVELAKNLFAMRSIEQTANIAPGQILSVPAKLWVGPQDQDALEAVAPGLDLVVDYGLLSIIAKPVFMLMTLIHKFVSNWGWTIILLTLLIKLAFYPLSAASYRSMAKMKHVAPRLQILKEKFGDDRQKMNTAMMEMYRTEKINPLGGCIPIVIQIPVFISLYYVLLSSVELRGAPWILWVNDLAVRDPYFILPALMMGTMFLQMKLNPKPPDPMQAKVMMFMPLVFGGMMFFFPAGLVLYWCVNNILSITQQWYITRKMNTAANEPHR
jgi:YidC/Oxa1 family membrane protein insertase